MNARSKKKVSKNSELKTTLIILLIFVLCAGTIIFLHKQKQIVKNPKVFKPPIVIVPPTVLQSALPVTVKLNKTPIRKAVPSINVKSFKIAFVIDDWGYSTRNCTILSDIKYPLAVSILPNLRHSLDVVKCAQNANKEVMLHLPMQPYFNHDPYPDNYVLTTTMSPNKVESILESILKKMPEIAGVNNHMGSKAMEDKRLLKLLFRHLKQHHLFFVDSMTSPNHSYGSEVAKEYGLSFGQRDVFLDNTNSRESILKQFDELMSKATKKGYAIAIGHDRELTMRMIKEEAPVLEKHGFVIVSVKELLRKQ